MSFEIFYMQIICFGMLLLAAYFGGRISRRLKIGEVVGHVLGGLIVGPILLIVIEVRFPAYKEAMTSLHFFTFVFLSLIAFGIGDELSFKKLKSIGKDSLLICVIQAFATWVCITVTFLFLGFKPTTALILGSIGIATAPAVTFVIMNRLNIEGRMRNMLGGIVVLDDVIEVLIFSITIQIALALGGKNAISTFAIAVPVIKEFGFAILIGFGIFIILRLTLRRSWLEPKSSGKNSDKVLGPEFLSRLVSEMPGPAIQSFIIIFGTICLGVGLALHWGLPFLITAVSAGIFVVNFYSPEVFKSLRVENATSMYTLLFFALIGANAKIEAFHYDKLIFIFAYIGARGLGKIGGTWLGCKITKQEQRITKILPKLMLPQAGVAAVEAYFVATIMGAEGEVILSIILPGLIVFEIVGVLISERSLMKWRSWMTGGGELIGEEENIRHKLETEKLELRDILKPECLKVPLDVETKGEAIWELIRTLKIEGYLENPGKILNIILEREKQEGTTIGEGIAILHGRIPNIPKPFAALGIVPRGKGINFGGTEDTFVDIIFMLLSPEEKPELHLQALSAIAKVLNDPKTRDSIRYSKSEDEIIDLILQKNLA